MSSVFAVLQKLMGDIASETPMRENNCGLRVPARFNPYVVYKFRHSMAKSKI